MEAIYQRGIRKLLTRFLAERGEMSPQQACSKSFFLERSLGWGPGVHPSGRLSAISALNLGLETVHRATLFAPAISQLAPALSSSPWQAWCLPFFVGREQKFSWTLAWWLSWLEHRPVHQKVSGSTPSQGVCGRQLICFSLSLCICIDVSI